jgi:hypothetical protein
MAKKTEMEYLVLSLFIVGVVACIYYLISVLGAEVNEAVVIEKTILVSIIMAILITLVIVLLRQIDLRNELESLKESATSRKEARKRTEKDVKAEMMKLYRDMGALKIILHDQIISQQDYDKEKRLLEKKVKELKKEYESLKGKKVMK